MHVWSRKSSDFESGLLSSIWARASLLSQLSCCEYFGVSVHRGRLSDHFDLPMEGGIHLLPQSGSYFVFKLKILPSGHNQAPFKQGMMSFKLSVVLSPSTGKEDIYTRVWDDLRDFGETTVLGKMELTCLTTAV